MHSCRILVADDDVVARTVVGAILRKQGFEIEVAADGVAAWERLQAPDAPPLVVLDWMMPGLDGTEICRRLRTRGAERTTYVILLTARTASDDVVTGLEAGADDFVSKPPNEKELVARVSVGARVVALQQALADRVRSLEEALANVKQLQKLLPICSYCKRIRDDKNYWQQVESYIGDHAGVQFSHSFCPECYARYVQPQLDELDRYKP
ncbi:MAG: response regulator [Acidobacteriota bacterium]